MQSGRRQSVLIFCTSPVSELYTAPAEHYDPDRIYVFMSNRDDTFSRIERKVYDTVCGNISCKNIKLIETNTHDFEGILAGLIDIKKELQTEYGNDLDIFVNISSGTHEFAAAGTFASMLPGKSIAFRVEVSGIGITEHEIETDLSRLNCDISEPIMISRIQNEEPGEDIAIFLSVLKRMLRDTRSPKRADIVSELKKIPGGWTYNPDKKTNSGRTDSNTKDAMYLNRHYIKPAEKNGLIEITYNKNLRITDKGNAYINVYRPDDTEIMTDEICCNASSNKIMSDWKFDEMLEKDECVSDRIIIMNSCSEENIVEFERNGRSYRFRLGMD